MAQAGKQLPSASLLSTDQQLVSDFQHLGLAINSNEDGTPATVNGASIAARVALARHSVDDGTSEPSRPGQARQSMDDGTNYSRPLHHRKAVGDLQQTRAELDEQSLRRINGQSRSSANNQKDDAWLYERDPASELPSNPDTKDTVQAKPVVHETVKRHNHEIRQEVITRDIHEYHEITKIQPVIETIVLPTRHFIETADGGKVEIPEPKSVVDPNHAIVEKVVIHPRNPAVERVNWNVAVDDKIVDVASSHQHELHKTLPVAAALPGRKVPTVQGPIQGTAPS